MARAERLRSWMSGGWLRVRLCIQQQCAQWNVVDLLRTWASRSESEDAAAAFTAAASTCAPSIGEARVAEAEAEAEADMERGRGCVTLTYYA